MKPYISFFVGVVIGVILTGLVFRLRNPYAGVMAYDPNEDGVAMRFSFKKDFVYEIEKYSTVIFSVKRYNPNDKQTWN